MKKNILKGIVAASFVVVAMFSFQMETTNSAQATDCSTYCPVAGQGCILHYLESDTYVHCLNSWPKEQL